MAGVSGQMLRARGGDIVVVVQSGLVFNTSQGARADGRTLAARDESTDRRSSSSSYAARGIKNGAVGERFHMCANVVPLQASRMVLVPAHGSKAGLRDGSGMSSEPRVGGPNSTPVGGSRRADFLGSSSPSLPFSFARDLFPTADGATGTETLVFAWLDGQSCTRRLCFETNGGDDGFFASICGLIDTDGCWPLTALTSACF